jgi:small subunit ribosomal protein S9
VGGIAGTQGDPGQARANGRRGAGGSPDPRKADEHEARRHEIACQANDGQANDGQAHDDEGAGRGALCDVDGEADGRPPNEEGGVSVAEIATGRRKEAVARVRLLPGTGEFRLNGRSLDEYFTTRAHRLVVSAPLRLAGHDKDLDVVARIEGGGVSGQAGALRLGIARALIELDPELRPALKKEGYLSRDAREKERRKYGLKKARKAPQYSKR